MIPPSKFVRPKKHLGQHFLADQNIAQRIAKSVLAEKCPRVLEVGPGTGVLTRHLLQRPELEIWAIEIDTESVDYLKSHLPELGTRLLQADFLRFDIGAWWAGSFNLVGNFPYNISSQIFFKALEYRDQIPEIVGMIQREVADRIVAGHGNRTYGILSVLLQAFYDIAILFPVSENVFIPPPKVKSAVIRMTRNDRKELGCRHENFFRVVKTGFNQRRKTLRNALKSLTGPQPDSPEIQHLWGLRAEQLTVNDFICLTIALEKSGRMLAEPAGHISQ